MTSGDDAGGRILQLSVSAGGVPKRAVERVRVTELGLEGDAHEGKFHGGPERALCLFSIERIRALQAEGHPIVPGGIGENVTVEGLDWASVRPGRRLLLGDDVLVEVTRFTSPCFKIRSSFKNGDQLRVSEKTHPGDSRVYARVIRTGVIGSGDPIRLIVP
jgi:MOSC domain-containing protein YiiM